MVFVHLTVEEAQQLQKALSKLTDPSWNGSISANEVDAVESLHRQLTHACSQPPPVGVKGVMP
jgi:hypothetical protein